MKHAHIIHREQVTDCLRHAPTAVIGGTANAALASVFMWGSGWHREILLWMSSICLCGAYRVGLYVWNLRLSGAKCGERRIDLRIMWASLVNGAIWGVGIALAAIIATPGQFNILAALSGGMMGAAILTQGAFARAALLFIIPLSLGSVLAWTINPQASGFVGLLLAGNYLTMLGRGALDQQSQFVRQIETREELRDAGATVELLLSEFEAQSTDWLWEIDWDGCIVRPSPRFAEAAGSSIEDLEGTSFTQLFDEWTDLDTLKNHLAGRRSFRNLTLRLSIGGAPHWWTLSARSTSAGAMRGVASDITAQRQAEARIAHLAHFDGLTNLANRYSFNEHLDKVLARNADNSANVGILCLDLDRFKSVNDSLGHPIGDKLLCEAARRIEEIIRAGDFVARLGGDEFAILIEDEDALSTSNHVARRIIESMETPFEIDGMQILTGASIGIALAERGESNSTTMLKRGDLALYRAKANGRNQFAHYEPGMDESVSERRNLEIELRSALAEGQLALKYEPVIDIASGETVSCEALLRWNHPERGLVMPNDFIAIAEETGLIVQLGEWVIREATSELARWPRHMRMAVNISPIQLQSVNLVTVVMQAISTAGIEPNRLELEITENVFLLDQVINSKILHRLRDFGVRIALDDFGTGFSSLNYLRSFPFDKIKIDQCFVKELSERDDCRNIVRTIIGLANSLGMVTTAEGVERPEQLDWLRSEGCTEAQGYLFSSYAFASGLKRPEQGGSIPIYRNASCSLAIPSPHDLETATCNMESTPESNRSMRIMKRSA